MGSTSTVLAPSTTTIGIRSISSSNSKLFAMLPDADLINQASMLLSDASAAATDAAKDGGWWESYLNIFKQTLSFVHSVVDGPLRSVGWTQTWGVSIAIFTI